MMNSNKNVLNAITNDLKQQEIVRAENPYLTENQSPIIHTTINEKNLKNPLCTKWKEAHKIDFNSFDSRTKKRQTVDFQTFSENMISTLQGKNVVVNAGHFIPNSDDFHNVGDNPQTTWMRGCQLVKQLQNNGVQAKLSLMLNDIDLTTKSRSIINEHHITLPEAFRNMLVEHGLSEDDVLGCGWNDDIVYTEKKLSNRLEHLIRRKKIEEHLNTLNENYYTAMASSDVSDSIKESYARMTDF